MLLKKKILISAAALVLLLCSCGTEKSGSEIKVSLSKSIFDLATVVYNESQLSEIADFDGSMSELDARYHIECLRKSGSVYRVSFLGEKNVAVVLFDESENKILGAVHKIRLTRFAYDVFKIGQSLEEVMTADPEGEYLFLYTGRNDAPRVSSHYTADGYLITVEYDASNVIVGIDEELI